MTTPFDTTRLDEECERIALELAIDQASTFAPLTWQVRATLLGKIESAPTRDCCAEIFKRCRRPKMVPV